MGIYTSLFKQNVNVTQAYKGITHRGIDLSTGKVEQPVYLPKKAIEGYVHKILAGYTYNSKYYKDSPIIYIKHKDGSGSRYIHSYPRNVKVKVGDTIKAGTQVCATGNSGYSFGDHLHFEWLKKWDDLTSHTDPIPYLTLEDTEMFKIGDKIEFTQVQNIRKGSGTSYSVLRSSIVGEVATIKGGPREADSYTWWDMQFESGTGWVAEVGKFKIHVAQEPVIPPEQTECEKQIKILQDTITLRETELVALNEGLKSMTEELKLVNERVGFLESTLAVREKEYNDLAKEYERVLQDSHRFEADYLEAVRQLNELNKPHWTEDLKKKIYEVWDEYKERILKLVKRS